MLSFIVKSKQSLIYSISKVIHNSWTDSLFFFKRACSSKVDTIVPDEVINRIYKINEFDIPKKIPVEALEKNDFKLRLNKITKDGSFVKKLFLNHFDKDLLNYPSVFPTRKEFLVTSIQCEMIYKFFEDFILYPKTLNELGFYSLWKLTISEMIMHFEAMGTSLAKLNNLSISEPLNNDTKQAKIKYSILDKDVQINLLKLILHNCIGYGIIDNCDSDKIRDEMILKHVYKEIKIGFAWYEDYLMRKDFESWNSIAKLSKKQEHWIISGEKKLIIKDDYEYYAIFCHCEEYFEIGQQNLVPGIVGLLVPSSMIAEIKDDTIINGISYQKIKFDNLLLLRDDYQLIDPSPGGIRSLNIHGIGLLGISSVILGHLKTLLRECYTYLAEERFALLKCQSIETKLCDIVYKIYTLESCLYLTSQMYDYFDMINGNPQMDLEANIVKILAIEYAYEIITSLQTIYGSKMPFTSELYNVINIYDKFLGDSNYYRSRIIKIGLDHRKDFYKISNLNKIFNKILRKILTYNGNINNKYWSKNDLAGHAHPGLISTSNYLEYCYHKFTFSLDKFEEKTHLDEFVKQRDLQILSEMLIRLYLMTCVLSRGSRAYSDGFRNYDMDYRSTILIIHQNFFEFKRLYNLLDDNKSCSAVHEANIQKNGYSPISPINYI